eukprot:CAMPEP_0172514358 /NCGR_PEP_ID=MMETSP1066-20121228/259581_1 /TAXON_ID=671091 /ORGANISM="Coscinodiscus wailesii, Strain CCMP2513" /LENGTH=79 /DNA_ID=CAMNT_0013294993 /DNA_START=44 /DNA_END=279 /DNA_ORIENTATION=-
MHHSFTQIKLLLITLFFVDASNATNSTTQQLACTQRNPPIWPDQFLIVQRITPKSSSRVTPGTSVTYYDHIEGANLIQV